MSSTSTCSPPLGESPAYLIAAAYAAHRSGDRELERTARRRLTRQYGIRLIFSQPAQPQNTSTAGYRRQEVQDAR